MDDYISREEVVKKIKSCISVAEDAWESGYNTAMAEIMEWIKRIPAADVQRLAEQKSNGIVADVVREWDGDIDGGDE